MLLPWIISNDQDALEAYKHRGLSRNNWLTPPLYYQYYLLKLTATLNNDEKTILTNLIGANKPLNQAVHGVLIMPRIGTISPQASKALDILHCLGLNKVCRIEEGELFCLRQKYLNLKLEEAYSNIKNKCDPLLESVWSWKDFDSNKYFAETTPRLLQTLALSDKPTEDFVCMNEQHGLNLSANEIDYLIKHYQQTKRVPTDAEIVMFAQANSEHCRHKIFNATWQINGKPAKKSLFNMIRNTSEQSPHNILIAYDDNAAAIEAASLSQYWHVNPITREYINIEEDMPITIKVETHNHPTGISPRPGAATGSGGEIRDEVATGRGGYSKVGFSGFSVSHFNLNHEMLANQGKQSINEFSYPEWLASAKAIMQEAPVGAARFNNEFGRPCLGGYFRTLQVSCRNKDYGYHKPIMLAGGYGALRKQHIKKKKFPAGTPIVILGGPAMLIGLGGGVASSQRSGKQSVELDIASVQRSNPEMQRLCQEVINQCTTLGANNPILSIHDVGAGGLSNAIPELLRDASVGGQIDLRKIPLADPSMSPMEIWSNEAQERYVIALDPEYLSKFESICKREHCPYAIVGEATTKEQLIIEDSQSGKAVVDMPLATLLDEPKRLIEQIKITQVEEEHEQTKPLNQFPDLCEAVKNVLQFPAVASKSFLITIGDRSVGGMTARDQMVGPWQVPVADCGITTADYFAYTGEAFALGERSPVAIISAQASARLACAEAITNILSAGIEHLSDIKLSANWMSSCADATEYKALYEAVKTIGEDFCPKLGLAIPVGKDSLSMRVDWFDHKEQKQSIISPLSLIMSAFSPIQDVRNHLTPCLINQQDTSLILFDFSAGRNRLGGSALLQTMHLQACDFAYDQQSCPDIDDPELLKRFCKLLKTMRQEKKAIAYHDRSDGGLFTTVCEMMFASHLSIELSPEYFQENLIPKLFAEEAGVVLQVSNQDIEWLHSKAIECGLDQCYSVIGKVIPDSRNNPQLTLIESEDKTYNWSLQELQAYWSSYDYEIRSTRDNHECAKEEWESLCAARNPCLYADFDFSIPSRPSFSTPKHKPRVAILREQGVNGHKEMAAAFHYAGFEAIDVHINDLLNDEAHLDTFQVLAACGGFSFGDVLSAGRAWAARILYNNKLKDQFQKFFERKDTLTLGVCNGCQMLAQIKSLIPGAENFPAFRKNASQQFESRMVMVKISPINGSEESVFLQGMNGARLPIIVAHGEGRVEEEDLPHCCIRYVNEAGELDNSYPRNPNGSAGNQTGFSSKDGRVLIMMPHPERLFRTVQYTWSDPNWGELGPWYKLFYNAYQHCKRV